MAYVKTQGGQTVYPYSIGQLRKDNPNTSFPKSVPDSMLETYGVYPVTVVEAPAYNADTQRIEQDVHPAESNGQWVLGWSLFDLTAEEVNAKVSVKEALTRKKRNELLAATDWTANSDVTMSDEMRTYRQALRDVPSQAGFPRNVTWPVKP